VDDALVIVRLALAAIFAVAAAAKWTDRAATRRSARALGVPGAFARLVPLVLPPVELALAAALLPVSSAPYAAGALAVMLVAFTAIVAVNLVRGRRPSCHCFGSLDTEPIGGSTLARNTGLFAAAILVAAAGQRPGADILATGPAADVALFTGLVAAAYLIARRTPDAPRAAEPTKPPQRAGTTLEIGDRIPPLVLHDMSDVPVTLGAVSRAGQPVLLVLGDLGCGSCRTMLPLIEKWQIEHGDLFTPAFAVAASIDAARREADTARVDHFLVRRDAHVLEGFGRLRTPAAVLVDSEGIVMRAPVAGPDAIRALVGDLAGWRGAPYSPPVRTREHVHSGTVNVGAPAPRFRLPSPAGGVVTEQDLPPLPIALVFVDASSAPSAELLDELARSSRLRQHAMVVFLNGLPETPAAAPHAVLDDLGMLAAAFGITTVPSAVLVADGLIESGVVDGVDAVLAMLTARSTDTIPAGDLTSDFVPRPGDHIVAVGVNGKTIVADPTAMRYHALEATASVVWPWFDGTATVEEITSDLSKAFAAPLEAVRADVLEFARQLGTEGVLDGESGKADPSRTEPTGPDNAVS
jgi:uncharacterized membrane protein YphA (DoxX/SURF4 family)